MRESASAIHSNGWSLIVPAVAGASAKAASRSRSRPFGLALPGHEQRLDQQRQPLLRVTEHERRLAAGEDLAAHGFTAHGFAIGLRHGERGGIEPAGHRQLVQRALPLPEHAQQLEQEHAQFGIRRLGLDVVLEPRQRGRWVAIPKALLGGRHGHVRLYVSDLGEHRRRNCGRPASARPCPAPVYSMLILLNAKVTTSTRPMLPGGTPPSTRSTRRAHPRARSSETRAASYRPCATVSTADVIGSLDRRADISAVDARVDALDDLELLHEGPAGGNGAAARRQLLIHAPGPGDDLDFLGMSRILRLALDWAGLGAFDGQEHVALLALSVQGTPTPALLFGSRGSYVGAGLNRGETGRL